MTNKQDYDESKRGSNNVPDTYTYPEDYDKIFHAYTPNLTILNRLYTFVMVRGVRRGVKHGRLFSTFLILGEILHDSQILGHFNAHF